jgi:hypothetical protein
LEGVGHVPFEAAGGELQLEAEGLVRFTARLPGWGYRQL